MSTSYSEISGSDLLEERRFDLMDVSEDLLDEEFERDRTDPFHPRKQSVESCNVDVSHSIFLLLVEEDEKEPVMMKHFVVNDLEQKIKLSSPVSPSEPLRTIQKHLSCALPPQLDSNVLNDLEIEAQYLAAEIDNLTENLTNLLHSISSITADNVEVYTNSVTKLTDSIDSNIKAMYSIIAKTEEISKTTNRAEATALRIKEIRKLVDLFEAAL